MDSGSRHQNVIVYPRLGPYWAIDEYVEQQTVYTPEEFDRILKRVMRPDPWVLWRRLIVVVLFAVGLACLLAGLWVSR